MYLTGIKSQTNKVQHAKHSIITDCPVDIEMLI